MDIKIKMDIKIENLCEIEEKLGYYLKDFFRITLNNIKINIVYFLVQNIDRKVFLDFQNKS